MQHDSHLLNHSQPLHVSQQFSQWLSCRIGPHLSRNMVCCVCLVALHVGCMTHKRLVAYIVRASSKVTEWQCNARLKVWPSVSDCPTLSRDEASCSTMWCDVILCFVFVRHFLWRAFHENDCLSGGLCLACVWLCVCCEQWYRGSVDAWVTVSAKVVQQYLCDWLSDRLTDWLPDYYNVRILGWYAVTREVTCTLKSHEIFDARYAGRACALATTVRCGAV